MRNMDRKFDIEICGRYSWFVPTHRAQTRECQPNRIFLKTVVGGRTAQLAAPAPG